MPPSDGSQRVAARREGSPFTGLGPVFMKEFSDHLSSARMMVLMLFVIAFGALPVGLSLQELRNITESDPFLFLRIFTSAPQRVPFSFTASLTLVIPLLAIGLGFDSVNSEFNRRTLSRVLSQPIYRDALLLGKFLGGLATLAVALNSFRNQYGGVNNVHLLMAASLVTMIPCILLFLAAQKHFIEGLGKGAVKG